MALTDKLTAIANAIRTQSGKTAKLTLAEMPTEILDLQALTFQVIGGTAQPTAPRENDIWVNTDQNITSWHFGAEEPNVYDIQPISVGDPHWLVAPHELKEGDILNFVIPVTITAVYEAIRIVSPFTGKAYCVRQYDWSAPSLWIAGTKVSVCITNEVHQIGDWGGEGTARMIAWDGYSHEDGTVWIETALESAVQFNALKKNAVFVYPKSVKQYTGGKWESMVAKIYQAGNWVQFSSDFPEYWFHYVGHGWNAEMGAYKQWSSGSTVGTDEIAIPVVTYYDYDSYRDVADKVGIYQETAMDFTNFQKLKFEYKSDIYAESGATNGVFIGIGNTTADWPASNWDAHMIFRNAVADWTPYEIDISSVNKNSRLRLMVWAQKGSKAYIRNITLE